MRNLPEKGFRRDEICVWPELTVRPENNMDKNKFRKFRGGLSDETHPGRIVEGLRPLPDGCFASVATPQTVAGRGGWRPLCALASGHTLYGNGGSLLGCPDNCQDAVLPFVDSAPGTVRCALPVGASSAIAMTDSGAMEVSESGGIWHCKDSSVWNFPPVSFRAVDAGVRSFNVGNRSLAKSSAGATGLTAAGRAAVTADFENAYTSLSAEAAADGLYVAPVLAWCRYHDAEGRTLLTTPPVLVRGSAEFNPWVETAVDGWTEVHGYTVSVPVFSVEAEFCGESCPEVAGAEIYVTPQLHPYASGKASRVVETRGTSPGLRVSLPGYGLGVGGATVSCRNRLLRILGACPAMGALVRNVARPFSGGRIAVTVGRCGEQDAAAESRAVEDALTGTGRRPVLRDVLLRPPHTFGARCVAADAGAVVWGGVRAVRFPGFSPGFFAASTDGAAPWRALVTVTFGDRRKGTVFSAEYAGCAPLTLDPVLSYPSPDAREMRVTVYSGGVTRSAVFALEPDASGCRAVYMAPGLRPFVLPVVSAVQLVDLDSPDVEYPGVLAMAPAASPLEIDATVEAGGVISSIAVMHSADGAWEFGRCRFIVCGSGGLYSLAVGAGRQSSSLRLLDSRPAAGADSLAVAGDCVYAALSGAVVRVGSRSRGAVRIMDGDFESVAWNDSRRELYVSGAGAVTVYCPDFRGWYMRPDLGGVHVFMCGRRPYAMKDAWLGRLDIDDESVDVPVRIVFDLEPDDGMPFMPLAAELHACGWIDSGRMNLSVTGGSGKVSGICSLDFSGAVSSPLVCRILSRRVRRLRFELTGDAVPGFIFDKMVLYGC